MVQLLLRLGASINQTDSSGESPLHIACSLGYCHLAEELLQKACPNVNARTLQGTTALHAAAAQGSGELIDKLLSYGADINLQDKNGRSALHIAAMGGHSSVCARLMDAGAAAAVLDTTDNTPLHYAVSRTGIDISNIQQLIRKCPQALCITNKYGETPLIIALHLSVLEKQIGCTRILLAAGTEVDSRNHLGQTPLASAARDGSERAVALLLAAGASTRFLVARNVVDRDVVNPEITEMLKNASHEPLKLSSMCRRSLCRHFGRSGVLTDQLPFSWKDFLDFKTLDV